jgi:ankyrin repeat protein
LHIAAQRDYVELIKLLLSYNINVDQKDILGRNALFFAAKNNFLRSVKCLLNGRAKPGIKNNQGLNSLAVCTDEKTLSFLKKGFLLQVCLPLVKYNKRAEVWDSEGRFYFDS